MENMDSESTPLIIKPAPAPKQSKPEYSLADGYRMLYQNLEERSWLSLSFTMLLILGESICANQPAILLGIVVDRMSGISRADNPSPPAVLLSLVVDRMSDISGAVTSNDVSPDVWPLFGLICAALIGKELCTIGRKYLVEKSCTQLQKRGFLTQAKHLLAVRVDALQGRQVGDMAVRLDKSVEGLVKLQKVTLLEGLPNFCTAFIALLLAFLQHYTVGLAMLGMLCCAAMITVAQIRSQKGVRISLNEQKAKMGGCVAELLGSLGYIRAAGMRLTQEKCLEKVAEGLRATEFMHHKFMMGFHGSKDLIEGVGFVIVVGTSIHLTLAGTLNPGGVLTLSLLYSKASQPLQKMHGVVDKGHESIIKIGALGFVRALPEDKGLKGTLVPDSDFECPLIAKGLEVTLGGQQVDNGVPQQRVAVLKSLSLKLQQGEIVGLAGSSGSGKSTLLKVTLGLIPDYDGSLETFGAQVLDVKKMLLSRLVAYAQQEPFIMTGTLRDNLLLTIPDGQKDALPDDDALMYALERACLGSEDHTWSEGLDTYIHEAGRNLSGGQKQRLALARIFVQEKSKLIILDEATAALDNATEARVMDALHNFAIKGKRTVIMVAHRLTTLRKTNRILVMDDGCIVQNDTYQHLSTSDGVFKDLLEASNSSTPTDGIKKN